MKVIDAIKKAIKADKDIAPIILTNIQEDGMYLVIDGHHRLRAALEEGKNHISCFVTDLSWEASEPLREAERCLKKFDEDTEYKYKVSEYFKSYIGHSLNRYYRDHFYHIIKEPGATYKALKVIKRLILKVPMPGKIREVVFSLSGSKRNWR